MIFPAKCNIYEVNATSVLAVYGDAISATGSEVLLTLSWEALAPTTSAALEKTAAALGYPARSLAFATVGQLGANDLMSVVEGLDPIAMVVADARAAALLGEAYRRGVELDARSRLMGRTVVAFRELDALMESSDGKQKAWAQLKKLPKWE